MGSEGVVHAVADRVPELGLGHAAMQGEGGDQVDVVDAGLRGDVEHGLDDALAHVGAAHGREREADVVEGDGELHPRLQERSQRSGVAEGVLERGPDGRVGVVEGGQRLGRVQDPAAARGQLLEAERFAVVEEDRRRGAVHLEDEPRTRHQMESLSRSDRRSKAILTAPREPADAAWATASS